MKKYIAPTETAAYFCFGVHEFLRRCTQNLERFNGQHGFVSAVIGRVPLIEHLADVLCEEDNTGMFDYDLAEPAGEAVARAVVLGTDIDDAVHKVLVGYLVDNRMASRENASDYARVLLQTAWDRV